MAAYDRPRAYPGSQPRPGLQLFRHPGHLPQPSRRGNNDGTPLLLAAAEERQRWDNAGPEVFKLDELGKITLAAQGDDRAVVTDNSAGMLAAASGDALIAKNDAMIAKTTYREWLAR